MRLSRNEEPVSSGIAAALSLAGPENPGTRIHLCAGFVTDLGVVWSSTSGWVWPKHLRYVPGSVERNPPGDGLACWQEGRDHRRVSTGKPGTRTIATRRDLPFAELSPGSAPDLRSCCIRLIAIIC